MITTRNQNRPTAAVTLIEMMVVIGILAVVGYLVMRIVIQTNQVSSQVVRQHAAIQYGQLAVRQIGDVISGAIDPSNLELQNPAAAAPRFEKDLLRVTALDPAQDLMLSQQTIRCEMADGQVSGLVLETQPIAETARGRSAVPRTQKLGGDLPEGCQVQLALGYAAAPKPGQRVEYQETWSAGSWPALVQIKLVVRTKDQPGRPIELQTAVIPGLLPVSAPEASPAAAPAQSPATTPTLPASMPVPAGPQQKTVSQEDAG